MAPTRIIAPPIRIKMKNIRNHIFHYDCDDGNRYEVNELAAMVGLHRHSFLQRITRYGWDSEVILMPPAPKGKFIHGGNLVNCRSEQFYEVIGNEEWRALSGKSRAHKLESIGDIGTWEKERLSRKSSRPTIERRNKARNYDPYGGLPFGSFGAVTICE